MPCKRAFNTGQGMPGHQTNRKVFIYSYLQNLVKLYCLLQNVYLRSSNYSLLTTAKYTIYNIKYTIFPVACIHDNKSFWFVSNLKIVVHCCRRRRNCIRVKSKVFIYWCCKVFYLLKSISSCCTKEIPTKNSFQRWHWTTISDALYVEFILARAVIMEKLP